MNVDLAVEVVLWVALLPLVAASAYLALLALLALVPLRRRPKPAAARRRFAIVVPARDEERSLPALLASLRRMDYPEDLFTTTVVADNCSDGTARVAREWGAAIAERNDATSTGKGYALACGLGSLSGDYDAVVFIDADCTVSPNMLRAFNDRLAAGSDAIQAYYNMQASGASATQPVRAMALSLVHLVRPLGRSRFGGSAGLKGSGMCFSRVVIERIGWSAFGLAEDIEQHNRIVRAGMRVDFAPEVRVLGAAPDTLAGASGQHRRWEAGRLSATRREAPALVLEGLRARSLTRLDAAAELLVPPLSVLGLALVAVALAGAAAGATAVLLGAMLGIAALGLYVASGFILARTPLPDVVRSLAATPWYAGWKALLYVRTLASMPRTWESTRRD